VRIGRGAAIRCMFAAFHGETDPAGEQLAAPFPCVEVAAVPLMFRALCGEELEAMRQEGRRYVTAALPGRS
jgi:hypothetical protein